MLNRLRLAAIAGLGALVLVVANGATAAAPSDELAPLSAGQEPAPSLFGINTGTYDTSQARLSRDLPTAKRLGARWVHFLSLIHI